MARTTASDGLWEEIRNVEMSMYGLAPQTIESLYERLPVDPKALYLRLKKPGATAAISAIEVALNPQSDPEQHLFSVVSAENGLLVVSRKQNHANAIKQFDEAKEEARQAKIAANIKDE